MRVHPLIVATFVSLWLVAAPAPARAALFSISLDTSGLVGQGEFQIDFQLIDGDGVANTQALLRNFDFGSAPAGSAGAPNFDGDASGTVAGGFTISNNLSFGFNAVLLPFTPGNVLSFLLEVTGASSSPFDRFTVALIDATGQEVPTLGPVEEVVSLAMFARSMPESFGADPNRTTLRLPAPTVVAVAPVPEPSAVLLLVGGGVLWRWRRRP